MSDKQEVKKASRKPLGGGGVQQPKQDAYSFFMGEGDGFNMSPKVILLFSVAYMGTVILLHIFGKVASLKTKDAPVPETSQGDLWWRIHASFTLNEVTNEYDNNQFNAMTNNKFNE